MRVLAVGLLAALLVPGCSLVQEPQPRALEGPTDGHQPTSSYLKVFVERTDGTLVLVDFDRREWYVAELARRIDTRQVDFLGATVMPRNTLNEYLVQRVHTPSDLGSLRYDAMDASAEARTQMDGEYEALLQKAIQDAAEKAPRAPLPVLPDGALP